MRRTVWLVAAIHIAAVICEEDVWQEYYDKASHRKYYAHTETRESVWEPPHDVEVRYMDEESLRAAAAEAQEANGEAARTDGNNFFTVMLALGVPALVLFGGLYVFYLQASKEGLSDVLKALRLKRDRSTSRRSTKSKSGNYRPKFKLSQDGKGGRSANS